MRPFGGIDFLALFLVLALAAGARCWYVATCTDNGLGTPAFEVQGQPPRPDLPSDKEPRGQKTPTELDNLVHNVEKHGWFGSLAPLADKEENTAHVAPGYPWLVGTLSAWDVPADAIVRWVQCGLGVLTVACYFFFTRRAFQSLPIAFVAGLLTATHSFLILQTAELGDGVLATFLLAACLMLGTRAGQVGGPFTSLLFGLALAGLAMVRAALLPFACVSVLWFLLRCRSLKGGWFAAFLAVLGFANGLGPWTVRNWQEFGEPVPVADSALLHLWMGNNPKATGGYLDEATLRQSLPPERLKELLAEPNQSKRYAMLGKEVLQEVTDNPTDTLGRRLWSGLMFVFGENWFKNKTLARFQTGTEVVAPPTWLEEWAEALLRFDLLLLLCLGLLGWRFSHGWRKEARLAALAVIWVPLPYVLTHAALLSGPRLPLDGALLCYAAYALTCWLPGVQSEPDKTPARPLTVPFNRSL